MNFLTHRDKPIAIHLSSLQGYIQATHEQLITVFGVPHLGTDQDQFHSHWEIEFADGTVATIYDRHRATPPADAEVISWYVGGHSRLAAERVHETFRERLGLCAKVAA